MSDDLQKKLETTDLNVLNELSEISYTNSFNHKFWDDLQYHKDIEAVRSYQGNKLMLVVGEVSEAHEELRDGHPVTEIYYNESKPDKPEGVPAELADILIRVFDFAGKYKIDLAEAVRIKSLYNISRPALHGRKF